MTAATYTFTIDPLQSSTATMVVEIQPDTTSSTPGTDSRWQGGVRPRLNLSWPANTAQAQGTVNTAGNNVVDGPADYVWVKISSSPSDLTLNTSGLPRVRITDDDTGGGGGSKVVYSANSSDTGYVDLTSTGGKLETVLNDTAWITDLICAATGQPGYRMRQQVNGRVSGFNVASDGTESQDGGFNYIATPAFSNTPMVVTQTAAGDFTVTIGGELIRSLTRMAGGTYIRHRTGGAAVTSTITKN